MLLVSLNPVPVDDAKSSPNLSDVKSNSHQWFEERGQLERRGSLTRRHGEEMRMIDYVLV